MGLLEDVILKHSIDIKTTPEKIWEFFMNIEQNYETWHPEDHVLFRWKRGKPWEEGSVIYAEEYLHGKIHKLNFIINKVTAKREIEFCPTSRLLRIYFPKNRFIIEPMGELCNFTAEIHFRVGWIVKKFARKKLERGISDAKKHIREEGENLKRILEEQDN